MTTTPATRDAPAEFLTSHNHCFTCGENNHAGLHLDFQLSPGSTTCTWHPAPEFQSYAGRIHGGILTTLMDSAMVHALLTGGIQGVTATMDIRFRHPVTLGFPLVITGLHAESKRGIHYCSAEIRQNGETVVQASAKFLSLAAS